MAQVQGKRQALKHRDDEINRVINSLDLQDISTIFLEDLKQVKYKSKFSKKTNNKVQHWVYTKVRQKFEALCQENGILLDFVSPSYTSQCCSSCGG